MVDKSIRARRSPCYGADAAAQGTSDNDLGSADDDFTIRCQRKSREGGEVEVDLSEGIYLRN